MPEWRLDSRLHLPGGTTGTLYEKREVLRLSKSIRSKTPCVWRISPVQATPAVSSSETIKDLPMPSGGHTDASLMGHPATFLSSPSSPTGIGKFDDDLVLKISCVSGNSILKENELLQSCSGKFGIVKHFSSFPVFLASEIPSSSELFLPPNAIPLFTDDSGDPLNRSRSLWCHVTSYAGESLSTAGDVEEWLKSIACALIGYYILILNGIQHRDISIGNLRLSQKQASGKGERVMDALRKEGISEEQLVKLEELVEKLKIADKCTGTIIDLGMAINFKGLDYDDLDSTCHGTAPFISRDLCVATLLEEKYIRSPIDDLFSFLHTAHWSAAHNGDPEGKGHVPEMLHDMYNERSNVLSCSTGILKRLGATEFLITCQRFIQDWLYRLGCLQILSRKIFSEEPLEEAFRKVTYLGVVDSLECMLSFREKLNGGEDHM